MEELAKRAMVQLILGLHRTAVKEFTTAYRRVALRRATLPNAPTLVRTDAAELSAQFEIELLEDPPAIRLREFWDHAGALDGGVLFEGPRSPGQGARELVALNGICNAHQRISGDINEKDERKRGETNTSEEASGFSFKSAEAFKPIVSLLAGSAVAGGAAAGEHSLFASIGLGLATALISSITITRSTGSSRKQERQLDKVFIPDLSLRTLDRVLPMLLDRLRLAGLAPVLVIDELDKVDNLAQRIYGMVRCLKKLMAENVFSCFLTDRSYIEHLRIRGSAEAYGLTYSYFSYPLLVTHQPGDIDKYLGELLDVPALEAAPGTVDPSSNDRLDADVLKWILRHRSRLHALDLNRELAKIRSETGMVQISRGAVRSDYLYRIDVTLQVAIELQLCAPHVVSWLAQRPGMMQTLIDALYFLSRHWLDGEERIDLAWSVREQFAGLLCRRMNLDEVRIGSPGSNGSGKELAALGPDDVRLLLQVVQDVAKFLSETNTLENVKTAWANIQSQRAGVPIATPGQSVLDALLLGADSLLIKDSHAMQAYRWRYWPSGAPRVPGDEPQDLEVMKTQARKAADFIHRAEANLWTAFTPQNDTSEPNGAVFELLADTARILPTSPAWSRVKAAIANLDLIEKDQGNVSTFDADCRVLGDFAGMLRSHAAMLHHVLRVAAFLVGLGSAQAVHDRLRTGLYILSMGLRFAAIDSKDIGNAVAEFKDALDESLNINAHPQRADPPATVDIESHVFRTTVAEAWDDARQLSSRIDVAALVTKAWDAIYERLLEFALAKTERAAEPDEMLCAACGVGPSQPLALDIGAITLSEWTSALFASVGLRHEDPRNFVPLWVAPFCLRSLGYSPELAGSQVLPDFLSQVAARRNEGEAERARAYKLLEQDLFRHDEPTGAYRCALVLRRTRNSFMSAWRQRPTRGFILLLQASQVGDVRQLTPLLGNISAAQRPALVGAEQPPDVTAEETRLLKELSALDVPKTEVWIYAKAGGTTREPSIIGPKNADEILASSVSTQAKSAS
jgi:hypothetical protein